MQSFGERLKARYEEMGWTQAEFAEAVGVTPAAVSQWVSGGSNLSMPTLLRVSAKLALSLDYLLRGEGDITSVNIPYVGYVGLGGQVNRFTDKDVKKIKGFPVMAEEPSVAIRVQDDSMAPAYRSGDVLLVPVALRSPDDCLGRDAIVQLAGADGRELLRRVMPGTRASVYSLQSYSGGVIEAEIAGGRPVLARAVGMEIPAGG